MVRIVTVWIFFGSAEPAAAGGAGGAAGAGGGGNTDCPWAALADCAAGSVALCGTTGIVATTRGGAFCGWIGTGCSSRGTSFSAVLAALIPGFPADAACAGTILFGESLALMIGGSDGMNDLPPNME